MPVPRTPHRRAWRSAVVRALPVIAIGPLLAAACGDNDDAESTTTTATSIDSTATTTEEASTTSSPTTSSPTSTAAPGTPPSTTAPSTTAPSTTTNAPTTQAATTTQPPRELDTSALGLLEANLYSIPGRQTPCDVQDWADLFGAYLFATAGGDIYAMCVLSFGDLSGMELIPGHITLTDPSGNTVVDVDVADADELGPLPGGDLGPDGTYLELTYADGFRRAQGTRFSISSGSMLTIPIVLPHDRPAGRWTLTYTNGSLSISRPMFVDRPCATGEPPTSIADPLSFDATIEFFRFGTPPFDHCRLFPDLIDAPPEDVEPAVSAWAEASGQELSLEVVQACDEAVVVASTNPDPYFLDRNRLNRVLQGIQETDDAVVDVFVFLGPCD